jgi:sporulation protein YunB
MHLKKKITFKNKNNRTINKILLIIILIFVVTILVFNYVNRKVSPILLNYAEIESKKLASLVISKAINNEVAQSLNVEKLFILNKNETGEVSTIDFDPVIVNQFLLKAINTVQLNLKHIEDGEIDKIDLGEDVLVSYDKEKLKKGVFFEIPMGVVFNNTFLANLGPKIPVKFRIMGDIIANIESKVTNYGINNALIEIKVNLVLTERVILPITSKSIQVTINIPIALKIIQGIVPNYYFNGLNNSSSILTVPIE